jgi:hypothetical protein
MNMVCRIPKVFIKDGFVSPRPQVPTHHNKNCLPPFFLHLIAKVLEKSIPIIERKEILKNLGQHHQNS